MSAWAILTDVTKCIGCEECVAACKRTNNTGEDAPDEPIAHDCRQCKIETPGPGAGTPIERRSERLGRQAGAEGQPVQPAREQFVGLRTLDDRPMARQEVAIAGLNFDGQQGGIGRLRHSRASRCGEPRRRDSGTCASASIDAPSDRTKIARAIVSSERRDARASGKAASRLSRRARKSSP